MHDISLDDIRVPNVVFWEIRFLKAHEAFPVQLELAIFFKRAWGQGGHKIPVEFSNGQMLALPVALCQFFPGVQPTFTDL